MNTTTPRLRHKNRHTSTQIVQVDCLIDVKDLPEGSVINSNHFNYDEERLGPIRSYGMRHEPFFYTSCRDVLIDGTNRLREQLNRFKQYTENRRRNKS
jgi:hypothetical protein